MMQLLAFQNSGLSRKMDTHYGSLEKAFSIFKEALLGLRDEFQQNKDCTSSRLVLSECADDLLGES